MKSKLWPPVLLIISALSMWAVLDAEYVWEECFIFTPLICLILFYVWLDNHNL